VNRAAAAFNTGFSRPEVVIALPPTAVVPTVEAKPNTIAGRIPGKGNLVACTINALPAPTRIEMKSGASLTVTI
jgi:hypothetical protein